MAFQDYPSINEQRTYYDRWNSEYRTGELSSIDPEIVERAQEVLRSVEKKNLENARILEVGCGTGWFCSFLTKFGSVTGIDLSSMAIEHAREKVPEATFLDDDLVAHDFGDQKFDAIVCIETLFYAADQERFVRKLAKLMDSGGYIFVTTINKFVYERRSEIEPPESGQVRSWLSISETKKILGKHFDIESLDTIDPRGDTGILRITNSVRLTRILERLLGGDRLRSIKERLRLGGGVIIVGTRRSDS
jgi:2-polyprenyl-3-methyl-5-hydroxy-6-metoxy-1,4-benzoquinol methylase